VRVQMEFAASEEFRRFLDGLGELGEAQSVIHGIFIDIHPLWKALVDWRRMTGFDKFPVFPIDPFAFYVSHLGSPGQRGLLGTGPYDTREFLQIWQVICEMHDKKADPPFIVMLYVLPTTAHSWELRQQVERYARAQPFFASVFDSPMAVLAAPIQGGVGIHASASGALGGFLKDQSGDPWGVTCGHVAQQTTSSTAAIATGGTLGSVLYSNFATLAPQSAGTVCNQYVTKSNHAVDAALIKVASQHTATNSVQAIGKIDKIYDRTQLNSGNVIRMSGPMSGAHDYTIGGYGVTVKVQLSHGGTYYCFSDLFDFYSPASAPAWVPARVAQGVAPRPLQGDSGSWLCFNHSGNLYAYFGNLIAVRGAAGIATFADSLLLWAQNDCGLQLNPL
jgi:hypothetical protein